MKRKFKLVQGMGDKLHEKPDNRVKIGDEIYTIEKGNISVYIITSVKELKSGDDVSITAKSANKDWLGIDVWLSMHGHPQGWYKYKSEALKELTGGMM